MALMRLITPFFVATVLLFNARPVAALSVSDYFSFTYTVEFSKTEVRQNEIFYAIVRGQATCINDLPISPSEATSTGRIVAVNQATSEKVTLNPGYTVTIKPFPSRKGETIEQTQSVPLQFPQESPKGIYLVMTELIDAKVKAITWFDVSSFLPASKTAGLVNYLSESGSNGTGGPISTTTPNQPAGFIDISSAIDASGVFKKALVIDSEDGNCQLNINPDTRGLDGAGVPLKNLLLLIDKKILIQPDNVIILSPIYNFGPDGAKFDLPLSLTFSYHDSLIPRGINEKSLYWGYLDIAAGKWIKLESTVDPGVNKVTVKIMHFSGFAVMVDACPAKFSASKLAITPTKVAIGEKITISAFIANSGDFSSTLIGILLIDDSPVGYKAINLAGHGSEELVLTAIAEAIGPHKVELAGLSGTFTVGAPASFALRSLSITPGEVGTSEEVTVAVQVVNLDEFTGSCVLNLSINGLDIERKKVTVNGGEEQRVVFTVKKEAAGTYWVTVNDIAGSFIVKDQLYIWLAMIKRNLLWIALVVSASLGVLAIFILLRVKRKSC